MPSPVRLTGKEKKQATDAQRRYYWKIIVGMVAAKFEITKEQAHRGLAMRFLTVTPEKGLPYVRSTESLTTVEKEEYHRQCRQFGDEWLHIYIPSPNETDEFMPRGIQNEES